MNWELAGQVFVTLLVIMDPPGAIPVFMAVTQSLERDDRRRAALMAVVTAGLVIVLFALGGRQILAYLHVTLGALRCAGGLLLLLVALQLLQGRDLAENAVTPSQRRSIAMVPLGTPLLAGPGAIVATIVFVEQANGATDWSALGLGILGVHVVLWSALRFSAVLLKVLREAGVLLVTRVAGMLLAAIAVQMVADAVRELSAAN